MLLEEFGKPSAKKFKKINKMLAEQYGISISSKVASPDLESLQGKVYEHVQQLKVNGSVSNTCPELAKNLLILEGITELIEHRTLKEQHEELLSSGPYMRVIDWLSDFVAKNMELGDDEDDAIEQAMKEYRSSKWRFPDELIRHDCGRKARMLLAQRQKAYTMESSGKKLKTDEDAWDDVMDSSGRYVARKTADAPRREKPKFTLVGDDEDDVDSDYDEILARVKARLQKQQGKQNERHL